MSVKNQQYVEEYKADVKSIRDSLAALQAIAATFHEPDENNELPFLHYGHVSDVRSIAERLGEVAESANLFWKTFP